MKWVVETTVVDETLTYSFKAAKGHYLACSSVGRIHAGKLNRGKSAYWAVVTDGSVTLEGPSGRRTLIYVCATPLILATAAGGIIASIHGAAALAAFHGLAIAVTGVTQVVSVLVSPKNKIKSK